MNIKLRSFAVLTAALALVCAFTACGKKDSGAVKGTGKNYTLSKEKDFKYDLVKIDGADYVAILGINLPENFNAGLLGLNDTITVKIPNKIEGYTVGAIGNQAMCYNYVVSVTIPDSVIAIGHAAFTGSSISSIKLPKSLKQLGVWEIDGVSLGKMDSSSIFSGVFSGCDKLGGSIAIPSGVTVIKNFTFNGTGISEVIIPNSVTIIGMGAFTNCEKLTSVKLPSNTIQYYDTLTNKLPDSGNVNVFKGCSKLSLAVRNKIKESGYMGEF